MWGLFFLPEHMRDFWSCEFSSNEAYYHRDLKLLTIIIICHLVLEA